MEAWGRTPALGALDRHGGQVLSRESKLCVELLNIRNPILSMSVLAWWGSDDVIHSAKSDSKVSLIHSDQVSRVEVDLNCSLTFR